MTDNTENAFCRVGHINTIGTIQLGGISEIREKIEAAHQEIRSPAEEAILDILSDLTTLVNEVAMSQLR
jgi:hypothetical protein